MQDNTSASQEDKRTIRELIDQYARFTREGKLEEIMALYTPDVVAFDAIAALQFKGTDAYREQAIGRIKEYVQGMDEGIEKRYPEFA